MPFVRGVRVEYLVIHARHIILLEAANGHGSTHHRLGDAAGVKPHQRAVSSLDFDDAVQDGHQA